MSTEKMEVPAKLRYTKSHEWAREEKGEVVVGITAFAVEEMGHDIVHIDLPPAGKKVKQSESFGVIDSVKAAFDLYAPVGGQIVAVNTELGDNPSLIADSPFDKGWMIRISGWSPEELKGMLSAEAYRQMIESGGSSH